MLLLALVMTLKHPHLFSLQIVVRGRVNIDVYLGPLITSARCTYISHLFLDINYTNFLWNLKKQNLGLYFEMILDDFFIFNLKIFILTQFVITHKWS